MTQPTVPDAPSTELPQIPPGLLERPRKIRARRPIMSVVIWIPRLFILPHMIVGVCMIGVVIGYPIWRFMGTDHAAQVTAARYFATSAKGRSTDHYELTYAYPLAGQQRTGSTDVPWPVYQSAGGTMDAHSSNMLVEQPKLGTVNIRSLGFPPLIYDSTIDTTRPFAVAWGILILFTAFWNGILSIFVWMLYVIPMQNRRLYKKGKVGFGVIRDKTINRGKNTSYYLHYDFKTEEGLSGSAKMNVPSRNDYDKSTVGENVIVLHPDGKVKPSVLYEYGGYRCAD